MQINFKDIIGGILVLTSIFDAIKYYWAAQKIREIKTARGHSRKFLNAAIINDITKLTYGIIIIDVFIITSSILALITMFYNYWTVYIFYTYRGRGLINFKRPNFLLYVVNSFLPNKLRRRL
jgi:hypothetical protein